MLPGQVCFREKKPTRKILKCHGDGGSADGRGECLTKGEPLLLIAKTQGKQGTEEYKENPKLEMTKHETGNRTAKKLEKQGGATRG